MVARELRECCGAFLLGSDAFTWRDRVSLMVEESFLRIGETRRGRVWACTDNDATLVTTRMVLSRRVFIRFGRIVRSLLTVNKLEV